MSSDQMSGTQAIRLVAAREVGTRLRSRSFLVITIVLLAAVVGSVLLFHFLGRGQAASVQQIGVTAETAEYQQLLVSAGQATGKQIRTTVVDRAAGEAKVRDGDLAAVLVDAPDDWAARLQVVVNSALPNDLQAPLGLLARQLALNQQIVTLGGDPATVQQALASATVVTHPLQAADEHRAARIGMASVVGVLTYVMLLISIQLTGQGVVEEKANRIVELLLATIRPWELLAGKVLGIGIVTIAQVAVLAAAGAGTAVATGVLHMSAAVLTGVVGWALVWYLLGYFLYALVIAAAASLVSRQEDLASVATPVTVLVIAAYLIGQTTVPAHPNGTTTVVLSLVPLLSPVLMPMRAAYTVPGWQMAAAVALTLVTIAVTARLAGRVYGNAVLLTGSRVSLRTALRLDRSSRARLFGRGRQSGAVVEAAPAARDEEPEAPARDVPEDDRTASTAGLPG
ncbi:ABC transporter permease [Nocardia sp. BMG51109]|uniref:ABC transporter permease n=1 Tax=Nocardia sp. BMG51109 TaxID=1056816 RepID=UPI0004ADCE81|nr:ABC transporter permease [Nocardia sp. BMG51109]